MKGADLNSSIIKINQIIDLNDILLYPYIDHQASSSVCKMAI